MAGLVGFVYCIALPEIVALRQRSAWLVLLALLTTLWACLFSSRSEEREASRSCSTSGRCPC